MEVVRTRETSFIFSATSLRAAGRRSQMEATWHSTIFLLAMLDIASVRGQRGSKIGRAGRRREEQNHNGRDT
jgi:hypothetical protein